MTEEKPLVFKIIKMVPDHKHMEAIFTIEIVDEYTLQTLEKLYKHKLKFDGQTFTLENLIVPLNGAAENAPALWEKIKTDEALISKFVLMRIKGEL
jgi:hypothetical protein